MQPKISLLYAAIESTAPRRDGLKDADRLRADLVDGAFEALTADGLLDVRDAEAFAQRRDAIARALFGEAMRRLTQADTILALVAEVRAKLESKLIGWARANLDDLQAQLDALAGIDLQQAATTDVEDAVGHLPGTTLAAAGLQEQAGAGTLAQFTVGRPLLV